MNTYGTHRLYCKARGELSQDNNSNDGSASQQSTAITAAGSMTEQRSRTLKHEAVWYVLVVAVLCEYKLLHGGSFCPSDRELRM